MSDLAIAEWHARIRHMKTHKRAIGGIYVFYANIPCSQPFCPVLVGRTRVRDQDVTDQRWYCSLHGGYDT